MKSESSTLEMVISKEEELNKLNKNQKSVLYLYGVVVNEDMLTLSYQNNLDVRIDACNTADTLKSLAKEVLAIREYKKLEVQELMGPDVDLESQYGITDYEFYDFLEAINPRK